MALKKKLRWDLVALFLLVVSQSGCSPPLGPSPSASALGAVRKLSGHGFEVDSLAWAPSGSALVSGSFMDAG